MGKRLSRGFFNRPAPDVAPSLLGTLLVRQLEGQRVSGIITEVEAYQGQEDKACHASRGKTARNAVMFAEAGHAYVYFTYGMHWMMNVICDQPDVPAAVLIRAIHPVEGFGLMRARRDRDFGKPAWLEGPAKLTQALGINRNMNGADLCLPTSELWLESGLAPNPKAVLTSSRIGINYAPEPWFSMPWRWKIEQTEVNDLSKAIIGA